MSEPVEGDVLYRIRRPRPDDIESLRVLAAEVWSPDRADRFTDRWWWRDPEPHCSIAEHVPTGEVAAVCGQRRVRFTQAGTVLEAVAVGDWYVSPRHAGAGLGRQLVAEIDAPYRYTTGISDDAARAFDRLGWSGDRRVPIFVGSTHLSGRRRSTVGDLSLDVRAVAHGAGSLDGVDDVWRGLAWDDPAMMVRDEAQLAQHLALVPERAYGLVLASRRGRPVGYVLHRTLPPRTSSPGRGRRVGLIADYLVGRDDPAALRALVGAATAELRRQGAVAVATLASEPRHQRVLWRSGHVAGARLGGRLARKLSSRAMCGPGAAAADLHLTFADNDTDLILGT